MFHSIQKYVVAYYFFLNIHEKDTLEKKYNDNRSFVSNCLLCYWMDVELNQKFPLSRD